MKSIFTALKGMAMGMAEIVPGVSGGTIAFISGIYEELINTIKAFDVALIKKVITGKWKEVSTQANLTFLVPLLIGMFVGILVGIFAIDYLITEYPILVWSFFIGLIIASAIFLIQSVDKWAATSFLFLLLGIAIAAAISLIPASAGSSSLVYLFFSGAIAICALILPGISGSFILLLLGVYVFITGTIKDFLSGPSVDLLIPIGVFALGCLVGLIVFSRVVSYTYQKYPNQTLLLLTGFIIGAMVKIWPWRIPSSWIHDDGSISQALPASNHMDDWHVLHEKNVWPNQFEEPMLIGAIVCAIVGFLLVFLLTRKSKATT